MPVTVHIKFRLACQFDLEWNVLGDTWRHCHSQPMTRAFSKQYLKTSNKLEILPPEGPAESVTGRVYLADRTGSGWQDCLRAGRTALLRLQSVLQDRHTVTSCGHHTAGHPPHVPGELRRLPMQWLSRLVSRSVSHSVCSPCGTDWRVRLPKLEWIALTTCNWQAGQGHYRDRQADRDVSPE